MVDTQRPEVKSLALEVQNLCAWYGDSQALHGVGFDVREGELVSLVGRNGAGKSTILRSIIGILRKRTGSIKYFDRETIGMASRNIARLGIGYIPEERGIYGTLTVEENLKLPPRIAEGGLSEEEIFTLFPNLRERLGNDGRKLSGGEQQMLAIARVLRTGANVLLFDEPTEGLAPVIIQQIGLTIERLKKRGFTIILVEQNTFFATPLSERVFVVEEGHIVDTLVCDRTNIESDIKRLQAYIGV